MLKCRYPLDPYDRIWDADQNFTPFHVSTGFKIHRNFNLFTLRESPPAAVLETARVLARRKVLTYNLPLDKLADYYIVIYFAGIVPVSPSFDLFVNGDVVQSNYTVKMSEVSALYFTRKEIKSLNITLKSITYYPQIKAIEVYQIVDIPLEVSSTTGSIELYVVHYLIRSIFQSLDLYIFLLIYGLSKLSCSFSTSGYSAVH